MVRHTISWIQKECLIESEITFHTNWNKFIHESFSCLFSLFLSLTLSLSFSLNQSLSLSLSLCHSHSLCLSLSLSSLSFSLSLSLCLSPSLSYSLPLSLSLTLSVSLSLSLSSLSLSRALSLFQSDNGSTSPTLLSLFLPFSSLSWLITSFPISHRFLYYFLSILCFLFTSFSFCVSRTPSLGPRGARNIGPYSQRHRRTCRWARWEL